MLAALPLTVGLTSCSVTRYVPADTLLLDRVVVRGETGSTSAEDLQDYVRMRPNHRFLHLWRVGLAVYSMSGTRDTRWNRFLRRVGSAPVLLDSVDMERSVRQIRYRLQGLGYFDAEVNATMEPLRPKRCRVCFDVKAGEVCRVANVGYDVQDPGINKIVMENAGESLVRSGDPLDREVVENECSRLARLMQDAGYYSFGRENVIVVGDTSAGHRQADVTIMVVGNMTGKNKLDVSPFHKGIVDGVEVSLIPSGVSLASNPVVAQSDSFGQGRVVNTLADEKMSLRSRLFERNFFINVGDTYNLSEVEVTRHRLRSLSAVGQATIRFVKTDTISTDTADHIRCQAFVSLRKTQSLGVDVEGTNSSGNLGAALNVRYSHANLFHGAEALHLKYRIATQNQTAVSGKEHFFTFETGLEARLTLPTLLFPYQTLHFAKRHNPRTLVAASFDTQRRPEFTRTTVAGHLAYEWNGSANTTHTLTPIELNVVSIPTISSEFSAYIANSYLRYSYVDHFIMSLGYAFMFNKQKVRHGDRGWYLRTSIESAGNVLRALTSNQETSDGFMRLWNIRYAQYVRGEFDLRYHLAHADGTSSSVLRLFAGTGVPYGNSVALPFEKQFFAGGANSIRAWPVRGLGPGTQKANTELRYHDQMAEMRLEMNAEYRFKIFSVFEGAVFADAGNIWQLPRSESSPEGRFSSQFMRQLALGAGLGLRLNYDFFVFRVDAAYRLHDPSADQQWVVRDRFSSDNIGWNFAIGYPF